MAATLDSALAQSYPNFEIIVVDDGSTDNSWEIAKHYSAQYADRVKCFHQENSGVSTARNVGVSLSSGEFIAFLDADDYWSSDLLVELCNAINSTDIGLAYCGWQNVGLPGGKGEPFIPPDYENLPNKIEKIVSGARWPIHAALVRRELFDAVGGFNPNLATCEDFDVWMRICVDKKIALVPKVMAFYCFHDGEHATSNRERLIFDHVRVQKSFFSDRPDIARSLGAKTIRKLVFGELLHKGYEAYWSGDISTARRVFRFCFSRLYFNLKDLKYIVLSFLPKSVHQWCIRIKT